MTNLELKNRDLDVLWHPCTQMKDHETLPLIPIKKAYGVYLEDFDGKCYIDAISSWWVNLFGHTNSYINNKIKEQLDTLEHVILAGFTHEQVIKLSERLIVLAPNGLKKCFYADNGSSGVEVALKMSFHAHKNSSKERKLFVSLTNSYHGETIGALSVGDVKLYKDTYEPLLIQSIQTPVPKDMSLEATMEAANEFEKLCKSRADEISAIILEPLVQGAGSMHMYHKEFLVLVREICNRYGIHLIADEVMVGFGRTGELFACQSANITPDFLVLSKGLTGGYLPLSVVLTTNEIYAQFYCDYNEHKAFLHSHSYTGNALACAAANATLDLFERDDVIEKNRVTARYMSDKLLKFKELKNIASIRQTGMICAIELKGYKAEDRIGLKVYQYGLDNGVLLRPLGHVVYFMPPYIITLDECDKMIDTAYDAIKSLL
ncbi:MAG: adenosylmethionine--8-amino-7-oxononanoate transaminase [Sulfurimonas sp.]|jgi:adenosylmethionine-8-amino-7-oxononanoate aminotransferase|uniref:adenosylmethionine--8-amino-7-oxononanoate transaminase n=1 Tax=unclassified Sulfurimonas TaxID=2623549 RepID=UPI0008C9441F|nr:adenosylmethionine--8-amino-7-oxononanoate transaminase [Sulfurimonas sp. RIFOXYB12_FULL_35_9]MBS4069391.1 adenosylmethionine--8-amino-7-oxononanoate transaminase [Sulfurimonas sp.]MDX9756787.1 adenosylmethionine--8-amino-7-oxononanoate transaminase [Sulfurimonas sp.]OHE06504.1 MAG: adenosylmethionine--8-amino-7-oxononanoate transaminase [Sulfurimonas sp. RIFOXYB12_FULL_35_9]OHE07028.1 MAG: adenosylmethionine--8-amino-7-oxononanoate transaminase [Sulfurimonas sp. RIFOXYB2_FULL_37_5]